MIEIIDQPFDALARLAEERLRLASDVNIDEIGAMSSFVGSMRDHHLGRSITAMELHHYPIMTEKHLTTLAQQAKHDYSLQHALLVHRVGKMVPSDDIVLVAAWSAHRAHAITATQSLLEKLKFEAPFWKKEYFEDGSSQWVEKNTDYHLS